MKLKKIVSLCASLVLSLSSLLVFAPLVHAAADTCTWTGLGGDDNFSTAANWTGCDNGTVPENGDSLVFDNTGISVFQTPENDLVAASFDAITFQGNGDDFFAIEGNVFTITGGISNTSDDLHDINNDLVISGNQNLAATNGDIGLYGVLSGSGNLTKTGNQTVFIEGDNSSYAGTITVSTGILSVGHANALGTVGSGTTVTDGAQLMFNLDAISPTTFTIAEPLTLAGDGNGLLGTDFALGVIGCDPSCVDNADVTFSGSITLTANTLFATHSKVTLSGAISGNFALAMARTFPGQTVVNSNSNTSATTNGTLKAPAYTTTYSDAQASTPVTVNYNETVIVTGSRQNVFVPDGGVLKGTGTVGNITFASGGKIAPGLSPGCLNSGNLTFVNGSTYDFEVGGVTECTDYDQIKVTGAVTLGNGTLNFIRFNNFTPVAGQSYKIIDNDAADAVSGTFHNLAQGATFTVDGYVLAVSYTGGDGNDVVLTVQSLPASPNTGVKLLTANPIITLITTTLLAAGIALIARRYSKASAR